MTDPRDFETRAEMDRRLDAQARMTTPTPWGWIAAGAFIALCVLATKALTGAAEVFGEGCLLRLSSVLIQTGALLLGIGLLASVVRRMFLSGRLPIDRNKRTNIRVPRRL